MWSRKELKTKAKLSLKVNYWKAVFVAFIAIAIGMGSGGTSSAASSARNLAVPATNPTYQTQTYSTYTDYIDDYDYDEYGVDDEEELVQEFMQVNSDDSPSVSPAAIAVIALVAIPIILVGIAIAIAMGVFVINPLEVGVNRFFLCNLNQKAEVKEIAFGYDHNYRENVKTLFFRDLFIFLWSLLLIIPGIIKSYEYRMIPYLLADDPTLTKDEAFAQSKALMDGNKWEAFVLDLSFIGWMLLSLLTLGILAVFYVNPYMRLTNAALYERLRYGGTGDVASLEAGGNEYDVPVAPENMQA